MDERKLHDKGQAFKLRDGTTLHSIKDLYGHLSTMSDADFAHHVNEQKNDFAAWVEHAHGDKQLAYGLRQARSKTEMQKALFMAMFR